MDSSTSARQQKQVAAEGIASTSCPPPGLEVPAAAPAKIETSYLAGNIFKFHASGGDSAAAAAMASSVGYFEGGQGGCGGVLDSQGEWVSAVMATAPYLDAQGLQRALEILDCAINNVQQAKALDTAISDVYNAAGGSDAKEVLATSMPQLETAEFMRNYIYEQQHMLLYQLHCLRVEAAIGFNCEAETGAAAVVEADAKASTNDKNLDNGAHAQSTSDQGVATEADACGDDAVADRLLSALGHPQKTNQHGSANPNKAAQPSTAASAEAEAAVAQPNKQVDRTQRNTGRQVQTLSTSLQLLATEDPDCLFIVRRINKLGFKACRKLKQHFSAYGTVVRVLVAHSTVRQHGDPQCNSRRRPSSLGFVHMTSADAVRKVLADGEELEVDGSLIRVQRFERQPSDVIVEEVADAADAQHVSSEYDAFPKEDWCRQQSAYSTASTRTAASTAVSLESDIASTDAAGSSAEQESS